jgi:hypothetical protein
MVLLLFQFRPVLAQERTMGLILCDSAACPGYTLFAPWRYPITYLIDNLGRYIHSWPSAYRPGHMAYLLDDGSLLRAADVGNPWFGGGTGGRVEIIEWDGTLRWAFDYSSDSFCQHHDIKRLPNGNVLMIACEYKSRAQAIAAGRQPRLLPANQLWPDHLIEVNPVTNSIVWDWHVWDHLVQDFEPELPNYGVVRDHPELLDLNYVPCGAGADWTHCNAIAYNPELDQISISSRLFSEIWVIDHSTTPHEAHGHMGGRYGHGGDLLYRWGDAQAYRRGSAADRHLFFQHDIQWIPAGYPGAGHFLVHNNGVDVWRQYSTVDEFAAPLDSPGFYHRASDSAFGPDGTLWSFGDSTWFYSNIISGCERQFNGNTLVCEGLSGTLFEVTPDHRLVWMYINPVCDTGPMYQGAPIPYGSNYVFKTRRYAPDYDGLRGRNLTPGEPIERYLPGITAPPIRTSTRDVDLRLTPNLARHDLKMSFALTRRGRVRIDLFDCQGREIMNLLDRVLPAGPQSLNCQVSALAAGTYYCRLDADRAQSVARLVVVR